MTTFHKFIGIVNLILLTTVIYLWNQLLLLATIVTAFFILQLLLIFIFYAPIYGTVKAIRYLFSKKENKIELTIMEKILMFAPLVNMLLFIGIIVLLKRYGL